MTRHFVLGNQHLLVNMDKWLQVRDLYFPRVGQENHLVGHAHKIVILEGDRQTWLNDDAWRRELSYLPDTLVTDNTATNDAWGLSLKLHETVFCEKNLFFRQVMVTNTRQRRRNIRICFHHDFHLYTDGIGDTACYHPEADAVLHYKKAAYFLTSFIDGEEQPALHDFNIGEHVNPEIRMPRNPIAQGEVDSIIAFDMALKPGGTETFTYYLVAGQTLNDVLELQQWFLKEGASSCINHAVGCQHAWLENTSVDLSPLDERLVDLYKRSLLVIKTQTDSGGAILAANDTDNMLYNKDTYSYMWPRDGALVAIAMIKAGFHEFTKPFFRFCRDVLYKEGCLLHKYNPDGTLGSSWHPWVFNGRPSLPVQEDETALVLLALQTYYEHTQDREFIGELYDVMIKPMSEFLIRYQYENGLPRESYDLWEERRAIFTFTTAATLAGLHAAESLGHVAKDGVFCKNCSDEFDHIKKELREKLYNTSLKRFRRSITYENGNISYDNTLDASVYAVFSFGVLEADDPLVESTMRAVREQLWVNTRIGGIARYEGDHYHKVSDDVPGNPWIICTLWYAKWLIAVAATVKDLEEPLRLLNWVADTSLPTGIMPEQVHPHTGEPIGVSPLTWSHAEFVDTVTDYVNRLGELR